jgi:hypothetical protein
MVNMNGEFVQRLSDTAIIAQVRAATVDVNTIVANSLKLITESRCLLTLIGSSIKIDRE